MSPNPTLEVTPEIIRADGQNRVAKTAGQTGSAMGVITVGLWISHQFGWHGEMPAEVAVALGGIIATVAAVVTNWSRLKGRT